DDQFFLQIRLVEKDDFCVDAVNIHETCEPAHAAPEEGKLRFGHHGALHCYRRLMVRFPQIHNRLVHIACRQMEYDIVDIMYTERMKFFCSFFTYTIQLTDTCF